MNIVATGIYFFRLVIGEYGRRNKKTVIMNANLSILIYHLFFYDFREEDSSLLVGTV